MVEAGGNGAPGSLAVVFHDLAGRQRAIVTLRIESTRHPVRQQVPLFCEEEGVFRIHYAEGARDIDWRELPQLSYEVIDTGPSVAPAISAPYKIQEIDCVSRAPDFSSDATTIRSSPAGSYRESGDTGFTRWQRVPAAVRAALPAPSWFAYSLASIKAQERYLVEVDYPDDGIRTFTMTVRENLRPESQPTYMYPISVGIDSGGEFSLTQAMQTQTLIFWARSEAPRLVFQTAHDGRRAACSRIRIFRIDGSLPGWGDTKGGRDFVSWYEEGSGFLSYYGVREEWRPGAYLEATRRAVMSLWEAGYTTFVPTVSIYESTLYPSRYNRSYSQPDQDVLRRLLLFSEKYGLKLIAEIHPRSDEFAWTLDSRDPRAGLMVSKDGVTNFYQADGKTPNRPPLYNPVHPDVQARYVRMFGELADRYRDSPAFAGVSIRLMEATNPGLSNFHSLDWGYDDLTVSMFARETGIEVPGPRASPGGATTRAIARSRHDWIMDHEREQWTRWRSAKVRDLYSRIVARMRQSRPDLNLYSTVFARGATDTISGGGADSSAGWREAGIDTKALGTIDGVVLVNATHAFGRREATVARTQPLRDELLDPAKLRAFILPAKPAAFLAGANYIEQTELVLPPPALGYPADAKHGWTSTPASPAGRHFLERFAVPLAETDARMLGDGGNGYALGQPILHDWLAEYRVLPDIAFDAFRPATDPVAVWVHAPSTAESNGTGDFWFYIVNRERYSTRVSITLKNVSALNRPATGSAIALANNKFEVELEPYGLRVYRGNPGASLASVAASIPESDRMTALALVDSIEKMIVNPLGLVLLSGDHRSHLRGAGALLRAEFRAGHYWRVRTAAESWPMQEIYQRLSSVPPQLRAE
jgi:hypothetical protein